MGRFGVRVFEWVGLVFEWVPKLTIRSSISGGSLPVEQGAGLP